MENLRIFEEDGTLIGVKERDDVHRDGDWHETFQLWILEAGERPRLHVQLRSDGKKDFPGLFDITAAGHLEDGERRLNGLREVKEEIGLSLRFKDLVYLGVQQDEYQEGAFIDREFCHVHLYLYQGETYDVDPQETTGVWSMDLQEAEAMWKDGASAVVTDTATGEERVVTAADFAPHSAAYTTALLEGCRRLL
ncbi:NUDIX hydrolase [Alkalicoccus chagannorensis]|uniref:NUDIX hydrolase n=1 Tax=Alkalicoccus chagannorensis TaxID=427072 RepID=UPI000687469B|nr:NUDIX domain-containing protein [Alkalicoccus chagannorensis]